MKKLLIKLFVPVLLMSVPAVALAFEGTPTIAVPRFTVRTVETKGKLTQDKYTSISPFGVQEYKRTEFEKYEDIIKDVELPELTDKFIRRVVSGGRFTVVERAKVDKLLGEIKMGEDGLIDENSLIKKGKMIGAQYLVVGTLVHADAGIAYKPVAYTEQYYRVLDGTMRAEIRVIETATGKIMTAQAAEGRLQIKKMVGVYKKDDNDHPEKTFIDDLQNSLAQDMNSKIMDAFYPFKVVLVSDKIVTGNRGGNFGIKAGDVYAIYRPGAPVTDPDTGKILGTDEVKVAQVKITEVLDKMCRAEFAGPVVEVKIGDLIKPVAVPVK